MAQGMHLKTPMYPGDVLLTAALLIVFIASLPTGWKAIKHGNTVDPLRKEIERENLERVRGQAASRQDREAA